MLAVSIPKCSCSLPAFRSYTVSIIFVFSAKQPPEKRSNCSECGDRLLSYVSDHYAHSVYRIINVKLVYNVKIATKRRCHWILSDRFWRESDTFLKCLKKLLMWCH